MMKNNIQQPAGKIKNLSLYFKPRDSRGIAEMLYILQFGQGKKKLKIKTTQLKPKQKTKNQKFRQIKKNLKQHLKNQGYVLRPLLVIPKMKPFSKNKKELSKMLIIHKKPKKSKYKFTRRLLQKNQKDTKTSDQSVGLHWHFKRNLY